MGFKTDRLFCKIIKMIDNTNSLKEISDGAGNPLNIDFLAMEKEIIEMIDKDPNVLTVTSYFDGGINIGMYAAMHGFEEIVLRALDSEKASLQQSNHGMNIGMFAAGYDLQRATLKALENPEASKQTDNYGRTIKDIAIKHGLEVDDKKTNKKENKATSNTEAVISDIYDEILGK